MRYLTFLILTAAAGTAAAQPDARCGELVTLTTHGSTTISYSFAQAKPMASGPLSIVLLIGGGGWLDLDDRGCSRKLSRNVLVRMRSALNASGISTATVDTPSDLRSEDGFGVYRIARDHAQELGMIIAQLRARTQGPVWIAGHSRGSISAANAAARLTGPAAPDGVILLSAMMSSEMKARRAWAAHTVFSLALDAITIPLLIIGHAADNCVRSPPNLMGTVTTKTRSVRQQAATVTGGPVNPGRLPSMDACVVLEPHDFVDQETEVAAGIARFMRGDTF